MLIITPKFEEVMRERLSVKLPHVIKLSVNKWCEFWMQFQKFEGQMVLGRGWQYFCHRHRVVPNDLAMSRISDLGIKVHIYNHDSSTGCRVRCSRHNCIGDPAFVL
ncbi:hypothetical protein D1007_48793 [Hordeum vulgare]|nr:hypothetical protein D1007_48793 [Hordeum vulgare]